MKTKHITPEELDNLSATMLGGGFQQTSKMMKLAQSEGYATDLVGVVGDDGTVQAGALVVYTPGKFGTEGSIWLGPLCDGDNAEMLGAMTKAITESARSHSAISVTCWPNDVYQKHTSEGEADGEPNTAMVKHYESLGWKHGGFSTGYDSIINRWVYVKDLTGFDSSDKLLASYAKNTRRNVKIANNSGVHVRKLGRDELNIFHDVCALSSARQHFNLRDLEYFQTFYDIFGDDAEFMVSEVNLDEYLASWQEKLTKFTQEQQRLEKSLETSKYPDDVRKKLDTATKNVESAQKRIADAEERIARDGHVVPAAAALFVWHKQELVYFTSGSDDRYAKFYAPTALQHEMMSRCLERGVTRYNFYGISGVFDDPEDEGRGVLEFKQGFNGYVEELAGEFTLPVNKVRHAVSKAAHKLLRR